VECRLSTSRSALFISFILRIYFLAIYIPIYNCHASVGLELGCKTLRCRCRHHLLDTWVKWAKALFSSQKILQNFSDSPSHRIFRRMHEVLNIDENKK